MKHWILRGCLIATIGAASVAVAQNPFVGTWKLNPEKSHLTGSTMKFSPAANGMIRETVSEGSYTFKPDGKSYPALMGDTENWQALSGHSWKVAIHGTGGYTYTQTLNISDDGQKLTTNTMGTNPDGSGFHNSTVYTRLGEGKGLMGTWKSTEVKQSAERAMEFAANGNDGLTWNLPQIKATLNAKFDGKPYAPEGPTVPKGLTLSMTRTSPNSFHLVESMNGKPMYRGTYTVSDGGKVMTQTGKPVGQAQMETAVYDKQ